MGMKCDSHDGGTNLLGIPWNRPRLQQQLLAEVSRDQSLRHQQQPRRHQQQRHLRLPLPQHEKPSTASSSFCYPKTIASDTSSPRGKDNWQAHRRRSVESLDAKTASVRGFGQGQNRSVCQRLVPREEIQSRVMRCDRPGIHRLHVWWLLLLWTVACCLPGLVLAQTELVAWLGGTPGANDATGTGNSFPAARAATNMFWDKNLKCFFIFGGDASGGMESYMATGIA